MGSLMGGALRRGPPVRESLALRGHELSASLVAARSLERGE
jgi:hypothetical protein